VTAAARKIRILPRFLALDYPGRAPCAASPRQRAALILHDVLDWPTGEVAAMLETTAPAIHSALQRARATLTVREVDAARSEGREAQEAEAVARLVRAWETGNFAQLVAMLAEDAILSMPPWIYWLAGREAIAAGFHSPETWGGEPRAGHFRLVPTAMNGQPAALAYVRGDDGRHVAVCLTVLTLDPAGRISELTTFVLPTCFTAWGYPATLA
jgi:RNA polymerase sigma-70 factor (ECF subfamily)